MGSFLKEDPDAGPNNWHYCLASGIEGVAAGAMLVMISNAMCVTHQCTITSMLFTLNTQRIPFIQLLVSLINQQVARSLQEWRRVVWHGGIVWVSGCVYCLLVASYPFCSLIHINVQKKKKKKMADVRSTNNTTQHNISQQVFVSLVGGTL